MNSPEDSPMCDTLGSIRKEKIMSLEASIIDGKVTAATTATTKEGSVNTEKAAGSSMGKDAFLNLLVTQMKYQDPLEPTSNTEYISQFATFSQLEEMQNLRGSMDISRGSSLVGQYVTMKVKNEATGETNMVGGKVDYVAVENGKAYLSINGEKYSIDDLDSVVDQEYLNAYNLASDISSALKKLPNIASISSADRKIIENLGQVYDDMTAYQKGFIPEDEQVAIRAYREKLAELLKVSEENDDNISEGQGVSEDDTEKTAEEIAEAAKDTVDSDSEDKIVSDEEEEAGIEAAAAVTEA